MSDSHASRLAQIAETLETEVETLRESVEAAEADAQALELARRRFYAAWRKADTLHARRSRAINSFNREIDLLSNYAQRAMELAQAMLPVQQIVPPAVQAALGERSAIEATADAAAVAIIGTPVSGVYLLLEGSEIVYVGRSVNVAGRISNHITDTTKRFNRACYIPVNADEIDAVESALIALLKPRDNRRIISGDENSET